MTIQELLDNWKELAGEPKKQELYVQIDDKLYRIIETIEED